MSDYLNASSVKVTGYTGAVNTYPTNIANTNSDDNTSVFLTNNNKIEGSDNSDTIDGKEWQNNYRKWCRYF